jgi:hypothetical protein
MASSSRPVAAPGNVERARQHFLDAFLVQRNSRRQESGVARSASAPGVIQIFLVVFVVEEWLDRFLAVARQQYFDLLLRGAQRGLALARERHAAFERLERFFERHVALFELRHQRFELGQRLLEVGRLSFCSGFWAFAFTRATLNDRCHD